MTGRDVFLALLIFAAPLLGLAVFLNFLYQTYGRNVANLRRLTAELRRRLAHEQYERLVAHYESPHFRVQVRVAGSRGMGEEPDLHPAERDFLRLVVGRQVVPMDTPVEQLTPGMVAGRRLYDRHQRLLLRYGAELTDDMIEALRRQGIEQVVIAYDAAKMQGALQTA